MTETPVAPTPVKLVFCNSLRIENLASPTEEDQAAMIAPRKIKSPVSRFDTSGSLSPKLLPTIHDVEEPKGN